MGVEVCKFSPSPAQVLLGGRGNQHQLAMLVVFLGAPRLSLAHPREGEGGVLTMPMNRNKPLARTLRKNQTEIEGHLWQFLRGRQLGGYKFRRQHPIGAFIVDFYCPEKKLAVELDGDQHAEPGHISYDENREAILDKEGVKVLRYWDSDVLNDTNSVLDDILEELDKRDKE
jgi:very-short-patch-repair endonuclease